MKSFFSENECPTNDADLIEWIADGLLKKQRRHVSRIGSDASVDMQPQAKLSSAENVLPLRTRYRQEANCQIVGGSWKDKPTVFEFYVLPEPI